MVRVINSEVAEVKNVLKMQDGQIGVIERWNGSTDHDCVGWVVHRHYDDLLKVGGTRSHCWKNMFRGIRENTVRDMRYDTFADCDVRLFKSGERITLEIF